MFPLICFILFVLIVGVIEGIIFWYAPPVEREETDDPAFDTDSLF